MLKKIWNNLELYFLIPNMVLMIIVASLQVIMRFFFRSLVWSEELVRYCFLWEIWIGASYAIKVQRHLNIDALTSNLSGLPKKVLDLIVLLIWFCFTLFFALQGTNLVILLKAGGQLSPGMEIPIFYPYLSVTIGCILMSVRLIEQIYYTITRKDFTNLEIEGGV